MVRSHIMSCGCNLRKRINRENIKTNLRDVYLDYNATTKPDSQVLAEIERVNRIHWGNPSAQNSRGVDLYNLIMSKISLCKSIFKIEEYDTYFDTSSTSLINKISADPLYKDIISSTIEHPSLLNSADIKVSTNSYGVIDLIKLNKQLQNSKKQVIIYSPVNHETGNIQPIEDIYRIAQTHNTPVILDAVQTLPRLDIADWVPYCHGFYFSGHKIHSIQGAAALFVKKSTFNFNLKDSPLPFSLYSGTLNTPGVIGLLKAVEILQRNFTEYISSLKILHNEAMAILKKIESINIESTESAPGIINITLNNIDSIEDVLLFLSRQGIQTGRVSACSGDINAESYVLKAMGRDSLRAKNSLRLSFGKDSKRDDFFRVSSSLKKYYNQL